MFDGHLIAYKHEEKNSIQNIAIPTRVGIAKPQLEFFSKTLILVTVLAL